MNICRPLVDWFRRKKTADNKSWVIRRICGKVPEAEKDNLYNFYLKNDTVAVFKVQSQNVRNNEGEFYYISPYVQTISHTAELTHPDSPGKISVSVELDVKIVPAALDFGNWLLRERIEGLDKDSLTELLQQESFGISRYLQKILTGSNISLILSKREEAVAKSWLGHDIVLPQWLYIQQIRWNDMQALPSEAQKKIHLFSEKQETLNREVKEQELLLTSEADMNTIEEARKEMLHQNKLREIEREEAVKLAQAQSEAAQAEQNLKLQQAAHQQKMLELEEQNSRDEAALRQAHSEAEIAEIRQRMANSELQKANIIQERERLEAEVKQILAELKHIEETAARESELAIIRLQKETVEYDSAQAENQKIKKELTLLNIEEETKQTELMIKQTELQEKNAAAESNAMLAQTLQTLNDTLARLEEQQQDHDNNISQECGQKEKALAGDEAAECSDISIPAPTELPPSQPVLQTQSRLLKGTLFRLLPGEILTGEAFLFQKNSAVKKTYVRLTNYRLILCAPQGTPAMALGGSGTPDEITLSLKAEDIEGVVLKRKCSLLLQKKIELTMKLTAQNGHGCKNSVLILTGNSKIRRELLEQIYQWAA